MFENNIAQGVSGCKRKNEYLFEKIMQNFRKNIFYAIHMW